MTPQLRPAEVAELVGRDDPVILEIGANHGNETASLLRAMPAARIHAFEPDPRAIRAFKAHAFPPGVTLHETAVGNHDGTVAFHQSSGREDVYPEGWDQSGSIRAPKSHLTQWPSVKFDRKVEVPITRLDSWLAGQDIARVDFIWADVQGAEGDVIAGGAEALAMTRFLYTEFSNAEWYEGQPTLPALRRLLPGFELIRRFPMDVLFRNTRL